MLCRDDAALDGVLEHGINGFRYNSEKEFIDYASKLLEETSIRENMSTCSLQKANSFSSDSFAASVLEIYEEVMMKG